MDNFNMNGVFGQNSANSPPTPPRRESAVFGGGFFSADQWVDAVCCTLIAVGVILAAVFWEQITDVLFIKLLFPVISAGGAALLAVAAIAIPVLIFCGKGRKWFF